MTEEQQDWKDYGIKKYYYFALKVMNDPQYRMLAQRAWDARKKAHRWLHRGDCELCRRAYTEFCNNCLHNVYETERLNDNWKPKD